MSCGSFKKKITYKLFTGSPHELSTPVADNVYVKNMTKKFLRLRWERQWF